MPEVLAAVPEVNAGPETLWVFGIYIVAVFAIGAFAHFMMKRTDFIKNYFLGDRGLGTWTLSFSFAATAISGGTYMGFPSMIYMNGWSQAIWICSYMLSPLLTMALFGKRMAQVGRGLGAVTVPDVLRDRFDSRFLGLLATGSIIFFLTVNLVAQFKAGGLIMKVSMGPLLRDQFGVEPENVYFWGIVVFAVTVIAYTTYGGFWGVVLTDLLEGAVMLAGAVILVPLVIGMAGGLEASTRTLAETDPQLVYGPGPFNFLPTTLALSFLLYWPLIGAGQPSGMVRLMSFKDTPTLRKALAMVTVYYILVYVSLLLVFTAARAIYPTEYTAPGDSDSIMPIMIIRAAPPWLAGVLLAAPYAAIMSTVAAFILMISSGIVRDIYQRNFNPGMDSRTAKIAGYTVTAAVGVVVTLASLYPPDYLQYIILFTGTGLSASFLAPVILTLYWRRASRAGVIAAMLGGFGSAVLFYVLGFFGLRSEVQGLPTSFQPYYMLGIDPAIWCLGASFLLGIGVSLVTAPPPAAKVEPLFLDVHGDVHAKPE